MKDAVLAVTGVVILVEIRGEVPHTAAILPGLVLCGEKLGGEK